MGAAIGTDDKRARNVELNIVPFIDLMSCLTAFLLVTAVWVGTAQLDIHPRGNAREAPICDDGTCEDPKLSVLVEPDEVWIGVSRVNDFTRIPKVGASYDWGKVEEALRLQKKSAYFADKTTIEVAAHSTNESPVDYQQLIAAMDTAVKAGFVDVGLTDPQGLSARPSL
ncbi:MAG TPA: biopolymer transporter ExbD [Kofleriaceae bacterium]|nr:biopolymer transporter ExbD [Kofleriaceae bacterium]